MTGADIIAEAKRHLGEDGTRYWNDYPLPKGSHWCCAFVWDIFRMAGASKLFFDGKKTAYVPTATVWMQANCKKIALGKEKAGDIVVFTWSGNGYDKETGSRDHIGFIYKEGTGKKCYTIEGNTGASSPLKTTVMERIREAKYIYGIYRPPYTAKKGSESNGFDISYVQRNKTLEDFRLAKQDNDFVIMRLGTIYKGELYTDKEFESKYKLARQVGLNVGVYFYSLAKTVQDARKEANYTVKVLNRRALQYPVFIDFEDRTQKDLGKELNKRICEAFCKVVADAGYKAGVYSFYDYLTNRISPISDKYVLWLAQYPKATYKGRYEMHQYSSSGLVAGFGKIDVDTSTLKPGSYPEKKSDQKTDQKDKIVYPTLPKRGYFIKGDKGVNVKRLQDCLTKAGHKCAMDGVIGLKTIEAVKAFQKKNGLAVDGLFGKKSLAMLKKKLK